MLDVDERQWCEVDTNGVRRGVSQGNEGGGRTCGEGGDFIEIRSQK